MAPPSERRPRPGLGRLVAAAVAFAIVAPPALFALPLAALLAISRPRRTAELAALGAAGGYGVWWLLVPGTLPEQLVRAAGLLGAVALALLTARTTLSLTHRVLGSVAAAGAAVAILVAALGSSWNELRWWVAHRTGYATRWLLGALWSAAGSPAGGDAGRGPPGLHQIQELFTQAVAVVADYYPALLALEIMVGLVLGTALYRAVAAEPRGLPPGPLRCFRFSEHLGWAAAVPLVVLLLPKLSGVKLAALNVLVVLGGLYALRGMAVVAYVLHAAGGGSIVLGILAAGILVIFLPMVLGAAVVLGVLDTGLDLRRRWSKHG